MSDISEVIYVLGAVVLFSLFAITINKSMVINTESTVESEIEYNAIAVAQSIIDQARQRAFDEVMVGKNILELSSNPNELLPTFTEVGSLGPETDEEYPSYDDFDDYEFENHQFSTQYGTYSVKTELSYVELNEDLSTGLYTVVGPLSGKSFHKRLIVTVTHPSLPNPVKLEYIKTFY